PLAKTGVRERLMLSEATTEPLRMITLPLPESWLARPVRTLLIGAGGTGSHLFGALLALDHALRALAHPGGLQVTVYDPDRVAAHNIGRQAFWPQDVGQNKAETLVQRANLILGLDWQAIPRRFAGQAAELATFDLIVTTVDQAQVRARIGQAASPGADPGRPPILWLDTGNSATQAQVVLGHWRNPEVTTWIPNIFQLYPELARLDDRAQREPSCSAAEALSRQWLPINRLVADVAQSLLWMLFRQGQVETHGAWIDVRTLSVQPLRSDPQVWAGFGWQGLG
ncbi:MAG: PRTRC system ThiF family protein, partial [Candidatus Competibacteraceae bacterium]|nr:PRTRC system ThiF family protein [Candidatus Competibacteraceae bacterium]